MMYLVLAIVCSSLVSIVMRLTKTRVHNDSGLLAMNYVTCMLVGGAYMGFHNALPQGSGSVWSIGLGALTGALYLAGFIFLQWNVGKNGVVLSSTFMKLGLLMPIIFSVLFFGEVPTVYHLLGFVLAITAVLLINGGGDKTQARSRGALILLLLTCGTGDFMSKVYEVLGPSELNDQFLFYTFAFAMLLCLVLMIRKGEKITRREILWGILLGLPNYYSARFILRALEALKGVMPAMIIYPIFSVGSMVVLMLSGVALFRERLKKREWMGVGLILLALIMLNM